MVFLLLNRWSAGKQPTTDNSLWIHVGLAIPKHSKEICHCSPCEFSAYGSVHNVCIHSALLCNKSASSLQIYRQLVVPRTTSGWFAESMQTTCTLCTLCLCTLDTYWVHTYFKSMHLAHLAHLARVCKSAKIWHAHFAHSVLGVQSLHNVSNPLRQN